MKYYTARIFAAFRQSGGDLSLLELLTAIDHAIPERTLRRWLSKWVDEGRLVRIGRRRSTRYRLSEARVEPEFKFLRDLSPPANRRYCTSSATCGPIPPPPLKATR